MRLKIEDLRNEREWRSMLGLDRKRFEELLVHFKEVYYETNHCSLEEKLPQETYHRYCIKNEEDLLFFTLASLKCGNTYDQIGIFFGMDGSNAKRNQEKGLELLEKVLEKLGCLPKRNIMNKQEFSELFAKTETLIIDVTEHRITRPSDEQIQKDYYSGKKKAHTVKTLLIGNEEKKILFLSKCFVGKSHDYAILKSLFKPLEEGWFKDHHIKVDLGFQGIGTTYDCKNLSIPHKKPIKKELTAEQKLENQAMASERIIVEQSIGGLKRYRILSERLRTQLLDFYDKIIGICAGLWNFYLSSHFFVTH
jgi:hypothetical protein